MNKYLELKTRHEKEINEFPLVFAFSSKQFEEALAKLGLTLLDSDKVVSIGYGGFVKKEDYERFDKMFDRFNDEMTAAIENDKTGEGFIYEMFNYELNNHEYCITQDVSDTLHALSLDEEDFKNNPLLKKGLNKAIKNQRRCS